jgi:hypothetical protein
LTINDDDNGLTINDDDSVEIINLLDDSSDDDTAMIVAQKRAAVAVASVVTIPLVYHKDLYFHKLINTVEHELLRGKGLVEKGLVTGQYAEHENILVQKTITITAEMLYLFKGLNCVPHGQALVEDRSKNEVFMKNNNISFHHLSPEASNSMDSDYVKVFRAGMPEHNKAFNWAPHFNKEDMFDFLTKCCQLVATKKTVKPDEKRDGSLSVDSEVRQFSVGFSRLQGMRCANTEHLPDGHVLPYFSNEDLFAQVASGMGDKGHMAVRTIGEIMTVAYDAICDHYSDDNPFNDDIQNYLFGRRFAAVFGAESKVNFHYAGFYLEFMGYLHRHIDSENGGSIPYSHGASFSFLVVKDNQLWRANMIFAARKDCTDFMGRYRLGFPPRSGEPCSRCPMQDKNCAACARTNILFPSIPEDNLQN